MKAVVDLRLANNGLPFLEVSDPQGGLVLGDSENGVECRFLLEQFDFLLNCWLADLGFDGDEPA